MPSRSTTRSRRQIPAPDAGRRDLLIILAAALLVRLWGFRWGLPGATGDMTAIQEAWKFWHWGVRGGPDFNPHDFGWPSLLFYLAFIQQAIVFAWGHVSGAWPHAADFRIMYELDPSPLIVVGRAVSTAADLGVIALTWRLARSLYGREAAILAGAVVALDVQHIAWSQNIGPEVWVALFVLAGTASLLRIAAGGRERDYIVFGIATGLGIAAKYTPALLLAALPLAHRLAPRRRARGPGLAFIATALAFFAASPFVVLDPRESVFYIFSQSHRLAAVPHFGQEALGPGWLVYLGRSLPGAIGWIWLALGVAGIAVILRHPLRRDALPYVFPALYFILFGAGSTKYDHYMIPVTPFLAMAGAAFLTSGVRRLATRVPESRALRRAAPAAAILALCLPASGIVRRHAAMERPDPRGAARAWIESNVPKGTLILTEFGGPDLLDTARLDAIAGDPAMRDIAPRLLAALSTRPAYPIMTLPLYAQEPEESAVFYDPALYDGFEYCILSSAVSSRYASDPARFREQVGFYRTLDAMGGPVKVFAPEGDARAGGVTIRVYATHDLVARYVAYEEREGSSSAAGGAPSPAGIVRDAYRRLEAYAGTRAERAADFTTRLGHAFEDGGRIREAIDAWEFAVQLEPGDSGLHHALGEAFGRIGRDDLARAEYQKALAIDPDHVASLNNLGGIDLRSGDLAEARRLFERALALRPDFADAHANLGWILWIANHDTAGAREHFETALRLAPTHPGAPRLRAAIRAIDAGEPPPSLSPSSGAGVADRKGARP